MHYLRFLVRDPRTVVTVHYADSDTVKSVDVEAWAYQEQCTHLEREGCIVLGIAKQGEQL